MSARTRRLIVFLAGRVWNKVKTHLASPSLSPSLSPAEQSGSYVNTVKLRADSKHRSQYQFQSSSPHFRVQTVHFEPNLSLSVPIKSYWFSLRVAPKLELVGNLELLQGKKPHWGECFLHTGYIFISQILHSPISFIYKEHSHGPDYPFVHSVAETGTKLYRKNMWTVRKQDEVF